MSFWASFTASLRNFGNRITRIFTRKKDRHLENSKTVNQKTSPDAKKVSVSPIATDPKYVTNPLNDAPVTEEQFEKCKTYSPKAKHKVSVESSNSEPPGNSLAHMEGKPKDINQLYREMEEAVAQRVRETMELADARRRALAQSALIADQMAVSFDNRNETHEAVQDSRELIDITDHINNKIDENEDAIRIQEIVDSDDHLKKEDIQQEFEDINRSIEEEQAKMYRAVEDDKTKAKEMENVIQTGFEQSKTTDNAEKDSDSGSYPTKTDTAKINLNETQKVVKDKDSLPAEIEHSVKLKYLESAPWQSQIGFEHFEDLALNDPPYQQSYDRNEFETKQELAQGALNLAQDAINNTENISRAITDNSRLTDTLQTVTNNPFDLIEDTDAELRRIGKEALYLAESAVRNDSTNPFESSDDEVEIRLGDGTISMVQNDWRRQTRNPFETVDDSMEIRQMGEDALNIAQNASRTYAMNPFNMPDDEDEMRQIGADALSIAQTGARNVITKRQLSENAEDIDNALNSLVDSADLQNSVVEIGFDHFQHALHGAQDADENVPLIQTSK